MLMANGVSSLSVCSQRSLQEKRRVFIVPYSKIRLIATHCYFSPVIQVWTVSPPAFAFPYYFFKLENVWAAQNRFLSKGGGAEH